MGWRQPGATSGSNMPNLKSLWAFLTLFHFGVDVAMWISEVIHMSIFKASRARSLSW